MLRNFDSKKDLHRTKFELRRRILVKLRFRELRSSKLSHLSPFNKKAI